LVGGIPKHPEIIKRWQEARWTKSVKLANELSASGVTPETAAVATIESLGDTVLDEDAEAAVWTGFVVVPRSNLAALESRNVKAMLKESANIIKDMPEVRVADKKGGPKKSVALRSKLAERVFTLPKFIPILSGHLAVPFEYEEVPSLERPIHVMTNRGPRTALKRTDYLDDVDLQCKLRVLNDGMITQEILGHILDHASLNGLGTDRSQGAGTFTYELKLLGETE